MHKKKENSAEQQQVAVVGFGRYVPLGNGKAKEGGDFAVGSEA